MLKVLTAIPQRFIGRLFTCKFAQELVLLDELEVELLQHPCPSFNFGTEEPKICTEVAANGLVAFLFERLLGGTKL